MWGVLLARVEEVIHAIAKIKSSIEHMPCSLCLRSKLGTLHTAQGLCMGGWRFNAPLLARVFLR